MQEISDEVRELAKALCEKEGINPDEPFWHGPEFNMLGTAPSENAPDIAMFSPSWTLYVVEAIQSLRSTSQSASEVGACSL